jgi:hypothetical protein
LAPFLAAKKRVLTYRPWLAVKDGSYYQENKAKLLPQLSLVMVFVQTPGAVHCKWELTGGQTNPPISPNNFFLHVWIYFIVDLVLVVGISSLLSL